MEQYNLEQRLQIIQIYYQNSRSVVATLRGLQQMYGARNRPTRRTIERLVKKFESTYSLHNVPVPVRQRNARSNDNIAAARSSIQEDPNQSLTRRSQELGISVTSLWRIMRKDLGVHPLVEKMDQKIKKLKIQTGVLKRLSKEKLSYIREADEQKAKVQKMKAHGSDEAEIKKMNECMQESLMMIPDCQRRLEKAISDLKVILSDEFNSDEYKENGDVSAAKKALEEAEEHIKAE